MSYQIPTAALQQHIAILGKTGSGKTSTAKAAIVEPLLDAGAQVCILDPTSAWWGLRLAADGKSKGYERVILLGGERGDIPLSERSGEAVARLITEQGASCVIDTGAMTVGEYTRWFIAFATALYTGIRSPLHLIIDEAHHFMPQGKSPDVDAGRMLHAGNRLMSGGRSRGIRGVLITQRPAKLHKDSLTCADTLIPHRVIAPQDRAAIKEWIDGAGDPLQGKAVLDSLASLKRGEAWVWYPEGSHLQRVQFPMPRTFDSSRAPTAGGRAPKVAEIDLSAVRNAMAEAVREAEANDPKRLRARVAELERQLRDQKPAQPDAAAIEKLRHDARIEAAQGLTTIIAKRADLIRDMGIDLAAEIRAKFGEQESFLRGIVSNSIEAIRNIQKNTQPAAPAPVRAPLAVAAAYRMEAREPAEGLTNRQQRFLDAAATLASLQSEVTRETVCGWIGVHPRGGSVGEELKALEDSGFITVDRGTIRVTLIGMQAAGRIDPVQAITDAHAGLKPRQRKIFDIACRAYPDGVSRDAVAQQMGIHPRGGSFGEDIARLVGRGLITSERGELKARDFIVQHRGGAA